MAPAVLFLVLLFLQKATSNNTTCHNPCLRNTLEVRFPFGFENNRCSYPGFKLSCDNKIQITLDLPNIGNFTVRDINYGRQTVTIADPQNCLAKKFIDSSFDLSGSPFIPEYYNRFFTFLNCSSNSTAIISGIRRVNCLSNENFTVVTLPTDIYESFPDYMPPFCTELKKRVLVPVPWYRWSDSETRLIWNEPYCLPCEVDGGTCQFKGNTGLTIDCNGRSKGPLPRSAKYGIIIGAGIPGLLCIIGIGSYVFGRLKTRSSGNEPTTEMSTSVAPQPCVVITGLDGPTIESYLKTQLGDSGRLPKPNDNTCPICLSEYQPKDTLRTIPDCNHYFHANCVDEWLKMNATCPLCRNSLDGSSVMTHSSSPTSAYSSLSTP
ncbi:PREDICTED: RING-H2 finger protein ATL20-like [Populus euphratica]|uniref:RING-type E3 ubiquitin transferase n=1 Tax=Populus euphratica TaxID=75702 RepID=A0AAJ6UBY2_POPEU|nr:PREDICTED: RING-H2 finger protein ATL20-like [Populus euphratica]